MSQFLEGAPPQTGGMRSRTQSRYAPTSADAYKYSGRAPRLQFGDRGELTPRTIEQAGLQGEERERALEMLAVQQAYLEIYDFLDYPNDPDGHVVDLSGVHMTQPKVAIAWTLALLGFRRTGTSYIKKRRFTAPGVVEGAYTYVDVRAPDDAADELAPEHRADDHHLPPDTRRLAAIRDGEPGQQLPDGWHTKPVVTVEHVAREDKR